MKVLHLVSQDNGGAGRAAVRLHQALLEQNIDSQMLVQNKTTDLSSIHKITQTKQQKLLTLFRPVLDQFPTIFYRRKGKSIFSSTFFPSNRALLANVKEINPDIIHLHWINSGFINVYDLEKLNKPILWSLHDENPYTGGCHYTEKRCNKFRNYCHSCPLLESRFKYDISYLNFKRKQKVYKNLNLTVNGLSCWIASEAKSSKLFENKPIINLPNTIDTSIFHPIDKNLAKDIFGIDTQKYLLGFGAISGTNEKRKGYIQLKKALESLPNKHLYKLIIFGSSDGENIAGIETIFLGHLYDDITLRIMYSMLDATIMPSLSESFGQVALESLACGTPVICFDTTGLRDIVTHKYNGYLAQNFSSFDLLNGIQWLLSLSKNELWTIKENAINTAKKFDYKIVSRQYLDQYSKILNDLKIK